ncbi:MAG: DnaJ domain-containing protein [Chloroflexi bacterium]|nr:DnaJ domain-containing protein [Chloroflexota bacterium]
MLHDYYDLLGVSLDASEEEIDAAYRRLAEAYGRQRDPSSEEALRRIACAYEVISDPIHRAGYDQAHRLRAASPRLRFNLRQSLPWLIILAAALVLFLWSPWGRSLREGPTAVPSSPNAGQVTPAPTTPQPAATATPSVSAPTPSPRPTPTVLASREQCLAALHQDAIAAMDANCSSVL